MCVIFTVALGLLPLKLITSQTGHRAGGGGSTKTGPGKVESHCGVDDVNADFAEPIQRLVTSTDYVIDGLSHVRCCTILQGETGN